MKKRLFLLIITAFAVLQGMAQEVKVPKWERFARPSKEGVNLRKAPSTSSPRLMVKGGEFHADPIVYSWTGGAGYKPCSLPTTTYLPIIKEVGNWYLLYFSEDIEVYMRQDLCYVSTPYDIGPSIKEPFWVNGTTLAKIPGSRKPEVFASCYDDMGNWSDPFIYFGKKFGRGILWADFGDEGLEYAQRQCGATGSFNWFNAHKLSDQQVEKFMNTHKPVGDWNMISYMFDFDKAVTFHFNPTTYKHEMVSQPEVIRISKFIVGTDIKKGLQMYDKPNAKSNKLVRFHPAEFGIDYSVEYANSKMAKDDIYPYTCDYLAVIGEEGDWYKAMFCTEGYPFYNIVGYVMKSGCKDAIIKPITKEQAKGMYQTILFEYAGNSYLLEWKDSELRIMQIIDDIVQKEVVLRCETDSKAKTVTIFAWGKAIAQLSGSRFFVANEWGGQDLTLEKILPSEFSRIISKVTLDNQVPHSYFCIEGLDGIRSPQLGEYEGKSIVFDLKK